jgi:transcriptional regulator NrdR family protein
MDGATTQGYHAVNCPECDHPHNDVVDSRPREDKESIRRRRACKACGYRWTTREVIVTEYTRELSKAGAVEALNRIQDVLLSFTITERGKSNDT